MASSRNKTLRSWAAFARAVAFGVMVALLFIAPSLCWAEDAQADAPRSAQRDNLVEEVTFTNLITSEERVADSSLDPVDYPIDEYDYEWVRFEQPMAYGPGSFVQLQAHCVYEEEEVGIDCGMEWMCGLDPCLCGAADKWGQCACNGTETRTMALAWESGDERVARVISLFGDAYLLTTGPGTTTLSCTASLDHHHPAKAEIPIEVNLTDRSALDKIRSLATFFLVAVGGIVGLVASVRVRRKRKAS